MIGNLFLNSERVNSIVCNEILSGGFTVKSGSVSSEYCVNGGFVLEGNFEVLGPQGDKLGLSYSHREISQLIKNDLTRNGYNCDLLSIEVVPIDDSDDDLDDRLEVFEESTSFIVTLSGLAVPKS